MIKDKYIALLVFVITAAYLFGMISWPYMPKDKWVSNLYYITTSSVLYFFSLIVFIVSKSNILKIASCLSLGVFSINLYIELFLDPMHWTKWSWGLILVVSLNLFLTISIIEKIKQKRDGNNRNDK